MHDARLIPFLAEHADSDLGTLTLALREAARDDGFWTVPADNSECWQHAVAFEVHLYGVTAHGDSERELARNWREQAMNLAPALLAALPARPRKDAA